MNLACPREPECDQGLVEEEMGATIKAPVKGMGATIKAPVNMLSMAVII